MHNPIDIERRFQSLHSFLNYPASARQRLFEIDRFLDWLGDDFSQYESYLLELAQQLPGLIDGLNVAGSSPEQLRALAEKLRRLQAQLPALAAIPELTEATKILQHRTACLYAYAGDLQTTIALLDERLAANPPAWLAELSNGHHLRPLALLQHAREQAKNHNTEVVEFLDNLIASCFPEQSDGANGVEAPVIERSLFSFENDAQEGSLRRLSIKILGAASDACDEIDVDVRVIGAKPSVANMLQAPIAAARRFMFETYPRLDKKYFSGKINFDAAHACHEGNSANLAIAALFYCAVLRHTDQRRQFCLAESVAITGDVNERGDVLPVDGETLGVKVKAVFFSAAECLVLPKQQLHEAEAAAGELSKQYPHRQLTIIGVRHLREIFYDRRLTGRTYAGLAKHLARKMWRRKFSVGGIFTIALLLLIIAKLLYGPIDKHAVSAEFVEETMLVKNKYGEILQEIWVGGSTASSAKDAIGRQWVTFFDLDRDGYNEVIWLQNRLEQTGNTGFVSCKSISKDSLLWRVPLRRPLDFPRKPDVRSDQFRPNALAVGDFDGDSHPEVFVQAHHDYFPSLILKLNAIDGKELGHYVHIGCLGQMKFADLDGDGISEILLCGVNNAFRLACLVVLDSRFISGHSPLQGDYELAGYPPALEKAYVLIPKTVVGKVFQYETKFNTARWLVIENDSRRFHVVVREEFVEKTTFYNLDGVELSYYFNFDLAAESIGTTDVYDLMAEKLFADGRIPSLPNYEYFEAHKKTLLYWDGEAWQNRAVMNKHYLEVKGK